MSNQARGKRGWQQKTNGHQPQKKSKPNTNLVGNKEEGLTICASKCKGKGTKASLHSKIYHDPKRNRTYFRSYINVKVPFDNYVQSMQPTNYRNNTLSISPENLPLQTFQISVGDTLTVHTVSKDTSPPPTSQQGPSQKEKWYPFVVPWMTCQVLSIYQEEIKARCKKDGKQLKPLQKCRLQVRYFHRKTGASLKNVDIARNGNDNGNGNDCDKSDGINAVRKDTMNSKRREGQAIAKSKNMEETYETDICGEVELENILSKVYIVPNNKNRNDPGKPLCNVIKIHKEQDQKQNDTRPIHQFCHICLVQMKKVEYALISSTNGRCIYDDEDLGKAISQFIEENNVTSTRSRNIPKPGAGIDMFWLRRFCRGLKFLMNMDKNMDNTLINETLKYVVQRSRDTTSVTSSRREDKICSITSVEPTSKQLSEDITTTDNNNDSDHSFELSPSYMAEDKTIIKESAGINNIEFESLKGFHRIAPVAIDCDNNNNSDHVVSSNTTTPYNLCDNDAHHPPKKLKQPTQVHPIEIARKKIENQDDKNDHVEKLDEKEFLNKALLSMMFTWTKFSRLNKIGQEILWLIELSNFVVERTTGTDIFTFANNSELEEKKTSTTQQYYEAKDENKEKLMFEYIEQNMSASLQKEVKNCFGMKKTKDGKEQPLVINTKSLLIRKGIPYNSDGKLKLELIEKRRDANRKIRKSIKSIRRKYLFLSKWQ